MTGHTVAGICPVLATPFTEDGEVDRHSFVRMVRHLLSIGVRSFMYPGFASEYLKLTETERREMTLLLIDTVGDFDDAVVVCSVPDHSTRIAVQRARESVAMGADIINVLPPHQLSPSPAAVRRHIREIAQAVAPTPVIIQYAPAQTGTALDAPTIAELARNGPNIVQVKVESTPPGQLISALAQQEPALSAVVGYGGVQLVDALRRGVAGVQPGCSFAELYLAVWDSWHAGDTDSAIALHNRMLPFLSYWMQEVELIIAAEKRISFLRGHFAAETCRAPGRVLDALELDMIDRFLLEFHGDLNHA